MSVGLACDTLDLKNRFVFPDGTTIIDFTQSTLINMGNVKCSDYVILSDTFSARPDKVAIAKYGNQSRFDYICKYNNISNPLSIGEGQTLFMPDEDDMKANMATPKELKNTSDTGNDIQANNNNSNDFNKPKTAADKKRADYLKNKFDLTELTPPNINKEGEENVKIVDGKIILGASVSTKDTSCPEQMTRARLKQQLLAKNMFKKS